MQGEEHPPPDSVPAGRQKRPAQEQLHARPPPTSRQGRTSSSATQDEYDGDAEEDDEDSDYVDDSELEEDDESDTSAGTGDEVCEGEEDLRVLLQDAEDNGFVDVESDDGAGYGRGEANYSGTDESEGEANPHEDLPCPIIEFKQGEPLPERALVYKMKIAPIERCATQLKLQGGPEAHPTLVGKTLAKVGITKNARNRDKALAPVYQMPGAEDQRFMEYGIPIPNERARKRVEERIIRRLEKLNAMFSWRRHKEVFVYADDATVRQIYLHCFNKYSWRDDFTRRYALRPTWHYPDTEIVMKAECIFCADAGREDHGDRSRGPTTSTAEWCYPWRPENLRWHHANSHPAAYAKLKELHGVAEAAKGKAAKQKAEQEIDAFLEQPRNWLQHDYDVQVAAGNTSAVPPPNYPREDGYAVRVAELNKQAAALSDKHQAIKEREKRLDARTDAAKALELQNVMETNRLRDQLQRLCARELTLKEREDAFTRVCNAPTDVLQSKVVSLEAQVVQLFQENEELGDELALKNREIERLRGGTTLYDFVSDPQQQGNIESQEVLGESQLGGFQDLLHGEYKEEDAQPDEFFS